MGRLFIVASSLFRLVYGVSSRWTVCGEKAGRQIAIYSVASSGVEY
jgi:hypothetical protein